MKPERLKKLFNLKGVRPGGFCAWPVAGTQDCGIVFEIALGDQELRFRVDHMGAKRIACKLLDEVQRHERECPVKKQKGQDGKHDTA